MMLQRYIIIWIFQKKGDKNNDTDRKISDFQYFFYQFIEKKKIICQCFSVYKHLEKIYLHIKHSSRQEKFS